MSDYHHGNLRNALIVAAAELIEERGSNDFSMIDASRRAGVSSAAPYRHFKDRDALLEAVCLVAFMALSEATDAASQPFKTGTTEHIIALGKAYITFVTSHPEFYKLMWGDQGIQAIDSGSAELKSSAFYTLVDSVRELSGRDEGDALSLATKLWALVHGLSSLALNQHLEKMVPGADVYALLESGTHMFLAGLQSEQRS
jgi:AcrR family transcriptional regulator